MKGIVVEVVFLECIDVDEVLHKVLSTFMEQIIKCLIYTKCLPLDFCRLGVLAIFPSLKFLI